ncbi:MAG: acetate--CoA ligase family protein [Pseudomonadota bacterium]
MTPSASRLRALLSPHRVALIGASDNAQKLTARPMRFLQQHGFAGAVFPVNPMRETVLGTPAFRSVADIPETIDHAYVLLDAEPAIDAVRSCAAAGVPVVSVLADGFAEAGPDGLRRQQQLAQIANDADMLLIGPNSMGVVGTHAGFTCTANAAFAAPSLVPGRFAVLSQSGSVIGTLFSRGQARDLHFSALISVGNEAQSGIGEIGELLLDDPETDGFLLFLETIRNRDAIARFARRAWEQGKPILAYMVGRSDEGRALSVSHTGALTGGAAAVDSFLRSVGIRRVNMFETLLEAPVALHGKSVSAHRPRAATVVSTTGGGGAMVVDQISLRGVEIAGCSPTARTTLEAQGISLGHGKLVDVTLAGARYDTMKAVLSTLAHDAATGVLVVAIGSSAQFNPDLTVAPIVDAVAEAADDAAPVVAFPLPHAEESLRRLADHGVPTFRTVETCAETVALMLEPVAVSSDVALPLPEATVAAIDRSPPTVLNEVQSGVIFATLGVPFPDQIVVGLGDDLPKPLPIACPVVAKLIARDLPHKSDVGAVQIGIPDDDSLKAAMYEMVDSVTRLAPDSSPSDMLVQEKCLGLGEALIGLTRDPLSGPMVTVGMGGTLAEIYQDVSLRPAPVTIETAREMIAEVKGFAAFRGYRGKPKGDLEALAEAVEAISRLALHPRITEAEINPVIVKADGDGVVAVDSLVRLS